MNNYKMLLVAFIIFIMLFNIYILYFNKSNIAIFNIFIALIILLNVYYWLYYRKNILANYEKFNNEIVKDVDVPLDLPLCNSSFCTTTNDKLMKKGDGDFNYHMNFYKREIVNNYGSYKDIMSNEPLLAYSCLKISPLDFLSTLLQTKDTSFYGYKYSTLNNSNDAEIMKHIVSELLKFKNEIENNDINKIKGPVYVIMSQAPYLRFNGNIIEATDFNTGNRFGYYKETTSDSKSSFNDGKNLYTQILLLFPSYKTQKTISEFKHTFVGNDSYRLYNFIEKFKNYKSDYKLCFLNCINSKNLNCGCLNATIFDNDNTIIDDLNTAKKVYSYKTNDENNINGPEGVKGYKSVCLSANKNTEGKRLPENYSTMYFLNPYNSQLNKLILNHLQ